ncbi:methyltransferase domain-containing protein [Nocardioides jishulii]|uniref:Methyltransferase n=1 Tax=Nocardioides jishulii TaxID=2575440 RepID=A0A4V5TK04_9ACTN|nr:methyltransferase domain-containing protein [Nocardioides jishulii]QCX27168.1 methyltransferase [Nocardioides jishulii]TKI61653.1 methyltransferase [Nocardioides jishulii]
MSVSERRSAARSSVVWGALESVLEGADGHQVLDIGGGTGGFAVRVAALGHRVTVVDPSPDALAALARRAEEDDVDVAGLQGELSSLDSLVEPSSVDVVLCHGVLEVVEDPAQALEAIARVLRPGGVLSVVVAQRHAAVLARAMAGHFQQARELLEGGSSRPDGTKPNHRFTADEISDLVAGAGFSVGPLHAVRVFADLVPGSLVDLEPGASSALLELEKAVAGRAEYLPLAAQVHLLATR